MTTTPEQIAAGLGKLRRDWVKSLDLLKLAVRTTFRRIKDQPNDQ